MRNAVLLAGLGLVAALSGCATADTGAGPTAATEPVSPSATGNTTAAPPQTDLPDGVVAYLRAWAANDVATMQSNSAPDSPARAYADYWGSVYDAGRLDVGQADLRIREDSAVLTYTDGNAYRLSGFETDQGGVVTWKAVPGGPLATRIRTGQTTIRIAGVRVTAGTQYENTESSVRIVLDVHNNAKQRRDLEAPVYVSPDGSRSASALGADGRTGVIPVSPGSTQTGLVAAADAQIGGRLQVRVFDRAGQVLGAKTLALPN